MKTDAKMPSRLSFRDLISSPYIPGVFPAFLLALVGSALAGRAGLSDQVAPLLSNPKFSFVALLLFGFYMFGLTVVQTIRVSHANVPLGDRFSSIWTPISLALTAGLLLPIDNAPSVLFQSMLWALHVGAPV